MDAHSVRRKFFEGVSVVPKRKVVQASVAIEVGQQDVSVLGHVEIATEDAEKDIETIFQREHGRNGQPAHLFDGGPRVAIGADAPHERVRVHVDG